jgi:hypothetical protein
LFVFSLLFSPIIGVMAVYAGKGRVCPQCAENVRADALVCCHCGMTLPLFRRL